jgi:hypothetical protein
MAKSPQMTERLLGSNSIVGSDLGKVQIVARGIDQYDRHRALVQQTVVVVRGIQDSVHTLKMVAASRPSGRPVQGLLTL